MALPEPLRASAQHIGLLHDKIGLLHQRRHRLVDALVSAELQFLAALSRKAEAVWRAQRVAQTPAAAARPASPSSQARRARAV